MVKFSRWLKAQRSKAQGKSSSQDAELHPVAFGDAVVEGALSAEPLHGAYDQDSPLKPVDSGAGNAGAIAPADKMPQGYNQMGFDTLQGATIANVNFLNAGRDASVVNNHFYEGSTTLLDYLTVDNSRVIHLDNHAKRAKDTCLWFIEGELFQAWMESVGGMIWGTGMPGAGKTILASAVIEYLQRLADSNPGVSLSFAYCRYTEDMGVVDILLSLIRQQAERHPSVQQVISSAFMRHLREKTRPSLEELVSTLKTISETFERNIYILDGVDEVKEDVQVKLIRILSSVRAHFFLTSRPLLELEETVPNAVFFPISAQDGDIELMFDEKVHDTPRFGRLLRNNPGLREDVLLKIQTKARGMFLHASLQMDTIQYCLNIKDLQRELNAFPLKIEDLYVSTMGRVNNHPRPENARIAKDLIIWVLTTKRSLTIDELQYALEFCPGSQSFDHDCKIDGEVLVSLCFGLVTLDKTSRLVRLVHYTAQHILQRLLTPEYPQPHELIAAACIARLVSSDLHQWHKLQEYYVEPLFKRNPLLEYAYFNWAEHTRRCDRQSHVWDIAGQFVWQCQSFPYESPYSSDLDMLQGFHLVALYNLAELVNPVRYVERPPWQAMDINASTPISRHTPLMLASEYGNEETVSLLLQIPGVQVNRVDLWGITALMEASMGGHGGVVKLLLGAPGIQVNIHGNGKTALMDAASRGLEGVVNLLLSAAGIHVNETDRKGWTALFHASTNGYAGIVRALLDVSGIDINLVDDKGETALIHASRKGHKRVVELLQEFQADS